jgi:rubrerythrin
MSWSMDTQATSPTGRSATAPELSTPTAQGGTAGTSGVAETPATETSAAQTPATQTPATQTPATTAQASATATQVSDGSPSPSEIDQRAPGFRERGRMRRRMRFLRKARELAYRDLGGLAFEMHRLGQRHDELVAAKLEMLNRFDGELRTLEAALRERRPITVLREAGVAACPRCAAIHGSADSFCPACGTPMGPHADRPIAATPAPPPPPAAPLTPPPPAAPAPAPASPPPPQTANPPVAAPKVAEDDRPTEIIRPSDGGE